ncbi:hypothetical protein JOF56_007014 [Kibdelosporangium banguiense]|uniref:Uncharacterized protein n=1 Tax=Kibdelosporangium banguiense TaxID=1365924 RepID=A0ABS4TQD7_9PSEU|nr:hypothetical protein [Kibdelosporangium banguiense]MBP2326629.1 hypothetical protein [Kibdelosporangium banguiense]
MRAARRCAGIDQAMEINSCRMQYPYQGMAPGSSGDHNKLP